MSSLNAELSDFHWSSDQARDRCFKTTEGLFRDPAQRKALPMRIIQP